MNAFTVCSDSGAAEIADASVAWSAARGNRCSRSSRTAERPTTSPRIAAAVVCCAFAPVSLAATASDTRPARPAASRVGSTMPARRPVPVVILLSSCFQVSLSCGHLKTLVATGCGTATTTGLDAMEGASFGARFGPSARSRCSHDDDSGIHTFGTLTCCAPVTPGRFSSDLLASAAAMSADSALVTSTATHRSATLTPLRTQSVAVAWATGTSSGDTARLSRSGLSHPADAASSAVNWR